MLAPWNPFEDFARFDEFFAPRGQRIRRTASFAVAVDVTETDDAFVLHAEVPGVSPEDLDLSLDGNILTLKGERKSDSQTERAGVRRVERAFGSFERSFALPDSVDREALEAKVDHGVLQITLPKRRSEQPRKIPVKAANLADKAKKLFSKADAPATS